MARESLSESTISGKLRKHLETALPGVVVIKHSDGFTAGIPDFSVTWKRHTTWLEVKLDKGRGIRDKEIQHLTMMRLGRHGRAFYVVYVLEDDETLIVDPMDMNKSGKMVMTALKVSRGSGGFDPDLVAQFIREIHA